MDVVFSYFNDESGVGPCRRFAIRRPNILSLESGASTATTVTTWRAARICARVRRPTWSPPWRTRFGLLRRPVPRWGKTAGCAPRPREGAELYTSRVGTHSGLLEAARVGVHEPPRSAPAAAAGAAKCDNGHGPIRKTKLLAKGAQPGIWWRFDTKEIRYASRRVC